MAATAPLSRSALPVSPADLALQPERVRQLIALIVCHAAEICAYQTGTLELHFHESSVKGKLLQIWPAP